jgi:ribulose-phosphate 3-epimerase
MPDIKIMPSLLAAHMGRLEEACLLCQASGADGVHVDIMDGHFVPNLSMGPAIVKMARGCVSLPLNVHLMLTNPDRFVKPFAEAGTDTLLIHIEAECDVARTLEEIRELGMRPGITLNPDTPAGAVDEVLGAGLAEEVLCMTVYPGFGGQAFIPEVLSKLEQLRQKWPGLDLSTDGGLDGETTIRCAAHGANMFMIGTGLFKADNMSEEIERIRANARKAAEVWAT